MRGKLVHFEFIVEDQSGQKALEVLVPKIIGDGHTFTIHSYKGIGKIPKNLSPKGDVKKRILLEQLPRLLRGYGRAFAKYPSDYQAAFILVCDLDKKCLKDFRRELFAIRDKCTPRPETRFCIAIEEGEAWFLGDMSAIKSAYPRAKEAILNTYENDSICGTWEILAEALYNGGVAALSAKGWWAIGAEKSQWAEKISPHMNIKNNASPSFIYFRNTLLELTQTAS
jgi:hypothetical protein